MPGHLFPRALGVPSTQAASVTIEDRSTENLQRRIFPALTQSLGNSAWMRIIRSDPGMTSLVERRHKRMVANADCQPAPRCIVEGWKISADEQKIIGERLEALVSNASLGHSYDKAQWYRDSNALNYILSVYGEGAPPHYPAIDAMSLDSASKDFVHLIAGLQAQRLNDQDTERTIFTDPLYYASILLDANDRDDAIHLWEKWNAQPLQRYHRLRWRQYSYAAIIVPGAGPEAADTALSALGKFRLMVAVESYKKELAPFIIVSGGAVHPARTRYVEAEEMRRVLMQRFGIPEQSIVMEPYARHTTTNLRNASRIL
ncbi:YdcF family protein [Kozakia baliensis]|uniref:YdcF family protein n=1 Tax=Kozakia baliensis TaxID=153496 RepID=UPI001363F2C5|nr:YdcF family protein [Kozakia baliensis]